MRSTASSEWGRAGLVVVAWLVACSGVPRLSPPPPRAAGAADAGAEASPEPGSAGAEPVAPTAPPAEPEESEPPPRITLWCDDPSTAACQAAATALAVTPVETRAIPKYLLQGFQDPPDDCVDPAMAEVMAVLEMPLHLDPGRWVTQVGDEIYVGEVDDIYSGGGCLNSGGSGGEVVKIHYQLMAEGPRFLVRVWQRP